MRYGFAFMIVCAVVACGPVFAQGVLGDVMTGKLVNPKDGAWAWYDLRDAETEQGLLMRLAIVGRERVRRRQGHWLEVEIVPMVGYRSVYKMLVTGPASDPSHLHQLLVREGREPVVEMELGDAGASERSAPPEQERRLLGEEDVRTRGGATSSGRSGMNSGLVRKEVRFGLTTMSRRWGSCAWFLLPVSLRCATMVLAGRTRAA